MTLISSFIYTAGILACLLILIILFRSRKKGRSHLILFSIFFFLFFVPLAAYAELHQLTFLKGLAFLFADSLGFALGPLLYLYIRSLYSEEFGLRKFWIHLLPLVFYLIFISFPRWLDIWMPDISPNYVQLIDKLEPLLQLQAFYLIAYCLASLILLKSYRKLLEQNFSQLHEKELLWVRYLLIGLILTLIINLLVALYTYTQRPISFNPNFFTDTSLILLIFYLGYKGITQSRILLPAYVFEVKEDQKEVSSGINPHHLSNASEEEIEDLKSSLEKALKEDKLFLKEDLSLGELAGHLGTTDKKLSALLNQVLELNFFELINEHRVEEVKQKMQSPEYSHYTLLAIAYESGFKSKSSFNRIFKKNTGRSPSAYKKESTKL
ncbi:MAG: helix-turn-helix domain-containing protein [Bacteroidia bacterium]|nr:helix-turn-helix domain-containing protein [Bacteroidia bacterium]